MVPPDNPNIEDPGPSAAPGRAVDLGLQILLIFTVAAFGAVQTWSIAVMELFSFALLGTWLVGSILQRGKIEFVRSPVLLLWLALIGLILLQLAPLPPGMLTFLSPGMTDIVAISGIDRSAWRPLSVHPHATKEDLFKVLAYFSVFVIIIHHLRTKEQILRLVNTILGTGCVVVLFAVVQKATWNGRLYWLYPVTPTIESNQLYIWGPFVNHNHFAGYLELAAALAFGLLLFEVRRAYGSGPRSWRSVPRTLTALGQARVLWPAAAGTVLSAGILLSLSRGGIIAFSVAMLFVLALTRSRRALRRTGMTAALGGIVLMLVMAVGSWDRVIGRFGELAEQNRIPRLQVWTDSLGIIRDHPLFGSGAGTFAARFPQYQTMFSTTRFEHAENDYVETATDLGAAGLLIGLSLASVFFLSVLRAWRCRKNFFSQSIGAGAMAACVAMAVHGFSDFNLRIPANAMLATVIAGLAWAVVHNYRGTKAVDHA